MRILALDPATTTGIADGIAGATPTLSKIRFRHTVDETAEIIFGRAALWFAGYLEADDPPIAMVAIEAALVPSQVAGVTTFDTSLIAMGLQGLFHGLARARGIDTMRAPIAAWRQFFLGSTRMRRAEAKKAAIRNCALLGWGDVGPDAADAAGIWSWAVAMNFPHKAPRPEPLFTYGKATR
jgi:hypothetical protein